jgi:hypothetical protein
MSTNTFSTNHTELQAEIVTNSEAVGFLQQLRPPPWILVAIPPDITSDNLIITVTVHSIAAGNRCNRGNCGNLASLVCW